MPLPQSLLAGVVPLLGPDALAAAQHHAARLLGTEDVVLAVAEDRHARLTRYLAARAVDVPSDLGSSGGSPGAEALAPNAIDAVYALDGGYCIVRTASELSTYRAPSAELLAHLAEERGLPLIAAQAPLEWQRVDAIVSDRRVRQLKPVLVGTVIATLVAGAFAAGSTLYAGARDSAYRAQLAATEEQLARAQELLTTDKPQPARDTLSDIERLGALADEHGGHLARFNLAAGKTTWQLDLLSAPSPDVVRTLGRGVELATLPSGITRIEKKEVSR